MAVDRDPRRADEARRSPARAACSRRYASSASRARRPLLLFDSLEALSGRWGMRTASDFFGRCCPMLLDLGAIAYWSVPGASHYRALHREIEQITQCIIVVGEGRLRISKAEGRPPGAQGQLFRYSVQDGTLQLQPARPRRGSVRRCAPTGCAGS